MRTKKIGVRQDKRNLPKEGAVCVCIRCRKRIGEFVAKIKITSLIQKEHCKEEREKERKRSGGEGKVRRYHDRSISRAITMWRNLI